MGGRGYGRVIFNSRKDMHAKRKHKLFCSGNSSSQILIIQKGYKTGITFNSLACAVLREYVGGGVIGGGIYSVSVSVSVSGSGQPT